MGTEKSKEVITLDNRAHQDQLGGNKICFLEFSWDVEATMNTDSACFTVDV